MRVTVTPPSAEEILVDYASAGDTATAPADFVSVAGTLTLPPATQFKTVTVMVNGDTLDEVDERFTIGLANVQHGELGNATATITITDDDAAPKVSIAAAGAAENAPAGLVFPVTLAAVSGRTVTVGYATSNVTNVNNAADDSDYTPATGTLTFEPGETMKTIPITLAADDVDEVDEQFLVTLADPVGAVLVPPTEHATGTIVDASATPTVSVMPASAAEGDPAGLPFVVALSNPSGRVVTVAFATSSGSATAPADYAARSGTLMFMPGETMKPVVLTLVDDALDEPDETVLLTLTMPTLATLGTAQATGTILDDDSAPTVSIAATAPLIEGSAGITTGTIMVTLSAVSGVPVAVTYDVTDGTATAPGDFADPGGPLLFPPGVTTQVIAIDVVGDTLDEDDEAFTLTLTSVQGAVLGNATCAVTIPDDDALPALAITPVTASEGSPRGLPFVVTLTPASARPVTVGYATSDGTAGAADYTATSGVLDFLPGETARMIVVPVTGDTRDEPDETMRLTLAGPTGATLLTAQATGTITDDDLTPSLAIADAVVREDDAGLVLAFPVTLSAASGGDVTFTFGTTPGTAAAGVDYDTTSGMRTIAAGATAATIEVPIHADAVGEIDDDDAAPTVSSVPVVVDESAQVAVFTVRLSAASGRPVLVDFATADGSALAGGHARTGGEDYGARSGTLVFAPGELARRVPVAIIGDALDEPDEAFTLTLASTQAIVLSPAVEATVMDDDATPTLVVGDVTRIEGNAGAVVAQVPVTLSEPSGSTVTVDYATGGAAAPTATAGSDYVGRSGTLTFAPGVTSATIPITIITDVQDEPSERFVIDLSAASHAVIADAQAVITIASDDSGLPGLSIMTGGSVPESGSTATMTFNVVLGAISAVPVTVNYRTTTLGTASDANDFTPPAARSPSRPARRCGRSR